MRMQDNGDRPRWTTRVKGGASGGLYRSGGEPELVVGLLNSCRAVHFANPPSSGATMMS